MTNTLIRKAQNVLLYRATRRKYSEEEIDLAIAWMKNEVPHKGIEVVMKIAGSNVYNFLAIALKQAYQEKKIKI